MIALLHNIRSLHNVGSIFRTADAVGVEKLYLCGITPTPLARFGAVRPQLGKVALGAERTVPWEKRQATSKVIEELKRVGYHIVAVEQNKNAIPYYSFSPVAVSLSLERIAIVMGNELAGLPQSILKKADTIVEIPMRGTMVRQAHHPRQSGRGKESLNVSVAFGVIAFHCMRKP